MARGKNEERNVRRQVGRPNFYDWQSFPRTGQAGTEPYLESWPEEWVKSNIAHSESGLIPKGAGTGQGPFQAGDTVLSVDALRRMSEDVKKREDWANPRGMKRPDLTGITVKDDD